MIWKISAMKFGLSMILGGVLVSATALCAGCASETAGPEDNASQVDMQKAQEKVSTEQAPGLKCGDHICSRFQSCCDGPNGPICTTVACE